MLLFPSFGNLLLLSGLLIQLPSLLCMPGRYDSFIIGIMIICGGSHSSFLPLTTAWMAGKNRVEVLLMGLEDEETFPSLP